MEVVKKLKISETAKTLLANFSYLSIIEIIGLLLPIVSYPYLIRIVGPRLYGIVIFAQAIIAYIIIVVNFGFNVSATRRVSENRNNTYKLCEIYSSVVLQKLMLLFACSLITIPFLYIIKYEHSLIVIGLFGLCVQEVFFPTWMYQGLEKMKFITVITFLSKCSYLLLIFIFIKSESDYIYIPLLYSFGGLLTSFASVILLKEKFNITFIKITKSRLKEDFSESLPFFASRISGVIMERTNVIAIGSFFSYEMVAIYDLCTKVVSILKTPFSLVAQVIYPNVAKSRNMSIVKRVVGPLFFSGVCISLLIVLLASNIVLLLGGSNLSDAVPILQIMVWYVPIVGMSFIYGASVLVVNGHSKEYNMSVVYSVIFYLILMGILVICDRINLYTMVMTFILPEILVALYRIYITKKYNLLNS